MWSWGDVLDAGTGFGSMCWLLRQPCRTVTAITATDDGTYGATALRSALESRGAVEVVVGNWRSESFMRGRQFDVVVAVSVLFNQ